MKSLPGQQSGEVKGHAALQLFEERFSAENDAKSRKTFFNRERISNFLTQTALVLGFLGFGWALSAQFLETRPARDALRAQNAAKTDQTQIAAISGEIASLKEALEATRAASKTQNSEEIRTLKKGLENLKAGLESVRSETNSTIAQLGAKLDRAQHDPATKLQQIADRLEHIEKQVASNGAAGGSAVAAKTNSHPLPPPAPQVEKISSSGRSASNAEIDRTFPLISNWVVRDVYDGIALIEGEYGAIQVGPGENIPGAGRVKSIEKRGNGWIVITSRGFVDSAHD